MMRSTIAVVAGVVLWGLLWNVGTMVLMEAGLTSADEPITGTGVLAGLIAYSAVLSVLAGFVVGRIVTGDPMKTVWVFAVVQLSIGIAVQAGYWAFFPAWYHLVFLGLVIPATVLGGRLSRRDPQLVPSA